MKKQEEGSDGDRQIGRGTKKMNREERQRQQER